jgi:hypothetical protein
LTKMSTWWLTKRGECLPGKRSMEITHEIIPAEVVADQLDLCFTLPCLNTSHPPSFVRQLCLRTTRTNKTGQCNEDSHIYSVSLDQIAHHYFRITRCVEMLQHQWWTDLVHNPSKFRVSWIIDLRENSHIFQQQNFLKKGSEFEGIDRYAMGKYIGF